MPIPCNCRRVVGRRSPLSEFGEFRAVKSYRWDCPSCGLDRKRRLVEMCSTARVTRIVTLTFEQPRACPAGLMWFPGEHPAPEGFEGCDERSHVYWNDRSQKWCWRRLGNCVACCRWVSAALTRWRKRVRRVHEDFQYLQVKEDHKSGALHLHLAVFGIPASVTRTSKAGLLLKGAWHDVGGGFADLGRHGQDSRDQAGWYVGKYLAKRHDSSMAKGYRRWSRTAQFAPDVLMRPRFEPDDGWAEPGDPIVLGNWLHPDGSDPGYRWWPLTFSEPDPVRLDKRTAKCPPLRSVLADLAAWRALWVSRRGFEGLIPPDPDPTALAVSWELLTLSFPSP